MKKFILLVSFFVFIGSAGLFAQTYNIGDNWTLTVNSNGSYRLDDNDRGVCYYIAIEATSSQGDSFIVRVENWVGQFLSRQAIKQAIQTGLQAAGVAARIASVGAGTIVNIFIPSPAH